MKGIAVDGNNNVHISASSSIQVFNPEGKLIHEYGHPKLEASTIAISKGDPQLIVVTEYEAEKLFVYIWVLFFTLNLTYSHVIINRGGNKFHFQVNA